jgi:hypothetical protein
MQTFKQWLEDRQRLMTAELEKASRPVNYMQWNRLSDDERYELGKKDAADETFFPPEHYGSTEGGELRKPYLLGYLENGGNSRFLSPIDWLHVGIEGIKFGMPDEIKQRLV